MTDFLDKILAIKQVEVEQLVARRGQQSERCGDAPRGFAQAIETTPGLAVVAEVKKASPSKGLIQPNFNPVMTAEVYDRGGAACISVLTDESFFQGHMMHLQTVREAVHRPVLRKDFIIHELQIDEAYSVGADAVLLICAALTPQRLVELSKHAKSLGLDVLVEVHEERELEWAVEAKPSVIGVNNRDLKSFQVSLATSEHLVPMLPANIPVLSESGIRNREDARRMADCGARGVLVGESLMRSQEENGVEHALRALMVPISPVRSGEFR